MSIELAADFDADVGMWIDFAAIRCDWCDAHYPGDGLMREFPSVAFDAEHSGWQIMRLTWLVMCRDCHLSLVNGGER